MSNFRFNYWSTLRQVTYIICMIVVFSYIFFDVLDLDGSDFPLTHAPIERTVVVAEVPKDIEYTNLPDRTEIWVDVSALLQSTFGESVQLLRTSLSALRARDADRACNYRIALPRSSTIDPFYSV